MQLTYFCDDSGVFVFNYGAFLFEEYRVPKVIGLVQSPHTKTLPWKGEPTVFS